MDKTPAAWGPRASKNVRGTVNCNRDEGTTPEAGTGNERALRLFAASSRGSFRGAGDAGPLENRGHPGVLCRVGRSSIGQRPDHPAAPPTRSRHAALRSDHLHL